MKTEIEKEVDKLTKLAMQDKAFRECFLSACKDYLSKDKKEQKYVY